MAQDNTELNQLLKDCTNRIESKDYTVNRFWFGFFVGAIICFSILSFLYIMR